MQQLPLGLTRPPEPTLDNFVVGNNAEVVSTVRAIANGQFPARIVLISGPPGSGKSHLLSSLLGMPNAISLPETDIFSGSNPESAIVTADDVTDWSNANQHRLFNLINLLRDRPDSLIIASSRERPSRMQIRDDLRTRLASGLVLGLQLLNDDDKAQTLLQHASERGLNPDPAVINWLLTHKDRDIRSLIAYLDALDRYALQTRRRLSLPLLREFEIEQRAQANH